MKESPAIKFLKEQRRLLQIEYEEEKNSFTRITELAGIEKLKSRGNAWLDIRVGRSYYNSLNQRVIEIFRSVSEDEEDHNFEHGKPVMFFTFSHLFDSSFKILFSGEVSYVDAERMVVSVPETAEIELLNSSRDAGVMLSFDERSYRVMFEALDYVMACKGRLAELRDLIYSDQSFGSLSFSPIRFPYLNESQEKAVNKVLASKDIAIVHGPPGTGKTTTLVEAIYETLRREPQVLVCAQSNMAVDWISEKLVDRGVNVVRIGNPSRVNDKMLSFTYERRFEGHPLYPELWSIRKIIRQIHQERSKTESAHQKLDRLKNRATEIEIRINNDIFNSANVIASTLVGSDSRVLAGMKFTSLFIDEGAQALEAATWIPMRRAGRVIFAGDHCQLPPTVKSFEAMKGGLAGSLMERIAKKHPEAVELLTIQYRMHDDIMRFSNEWFYENRMISAPEVKDRSILDFDIPMEWIDTSELIENNNEDDEPLTYEESITDNFGKINKEEAELVLDTLKNYIEKIGLNRFLDENLDIGIISPYRAQTRYLRQLLKRSQLFKKLRKQISVNTVDGFQGQERDIIIISMVRSNDRKKIGFLNDLRRMNVAITRARMKLIIIGNSRTLSREPFYKKLFHYVKNHRNNLSL